MKAVSARAAIFFVIAAVAAAAIWAWAGEPKLTTPTIPTRAMKDISTLPDAEKRKQLTPEQYNVCFQNGTEPPFRNAYWNNHEPGIYVDVVSGEPLFASMHKFDSGTGWPSFFQPLDKDSIVEHRDTAYGMVRTEVRAKKSNAHLGHVFDDGPKPTGLRYCMNSAAMRFVPVSKLKEEGLEKYAGLFEAEAKK